MHCHHLITPLSIGVIYGVTRGTGTPTFWTEGYSNPIFQDEKVKNFLSPAANRSDLRRLSYNKTIFGRGSARTQLAESMTLSQTPESDEEESYLPILLPFRFGTQGCLVLLLNWYPHFLDQSYAPLTKHLLHLSDFSPLYRTCNR